MLRVPSLDPQCTPRRQEPRPVGERGRTKTKTPWTQPQLEALVSFMETQYPKYKGGRAVRERGSAALDGRGFRRVLRCRPGVADPADPPAGC